MSIGEGFLDLRERRHRHVRTVRLPNDARSVKAARDEVASVLGVAGWPDHSIDRARVVTSELATNALMHAGTGFELTIRVDGAARIEVGDSAPGVLPRRADPGEARPGGMGLYLVEAMAADWGFDRHATHKVVWAIVVASDLTVDRGRAGTLSRSPR